jgi:hypothetical protein
MLSSARENALEMGDRQRSAKGCHEIFKIRKSMIYRPSRFSPGGKMSNLLTIISALLRQESTT